MVGVAIIGYGYWGPNLLRNFSSTANCKVVCVVDAREERLELAKRSNSNVIGYKTVEEALANPEVNAVVIATPVFSHYPIAKQALLAGKHVLIEKPMASSTAEAEELIELAKQKNVKLMVDHTFLYTGAVQKIRELVQQNHIGKLKYFDSTRINLGLFQPDINVLWDLAPHDLSILSFVFNEKPVSVNATGISHTHNDIENIAYVTLNYASGFIAHFNCSWSSPVKIRQILIGGSDKMLVYNDIEPTEKIKIYDTGYTHQTDEDKQRILVDYRHGDIFIPKLNTREALSFMASDFIEYILKGISPISDADLGLSVVKILEASEKSIKQNGKEIIL
jgi:predicted dehydrogenase